MDANYLYVLAQYHAYANNILLEAASGLSIEELENASNLSHTSGFKHIRHLLTVEAHYLAECMGKPLDVDRQALSTMDGLVRACKLIEGAMGDFTESLSNEEASQILDVSIGGYKFRFPIWQLLLQVFMHSAHHRGELAVLLTSLGKPPHIDDIIVSFAEDSGQSWPWK